MDLKKFDIYRTFDDPNIKGPIVEVDEMIAPIISLLNKKGYKTRYCCSGHCYECDDGEFRTFTYILFQDILPKGITLPQGFSHTRTRKNKYDPKSRSLLEKENIGDSDFSLLSNIFNTMRDLYGWAEQLPKNIKIIKNYGG